MRHWWAWTPGASWRHPEGPGSSVSNRADHPVVQLAYADARAYVQWAGAALPTEEQWELAARGGLDGARYTWGDAPEGAGQRLANYWHGDFPWRAEEGYGSTAPVGSFPPNGYGLYDMAGNVWEWTPLVVRAALRSRPARGPRAPPRRQGRLVPVRRQLLRPLPARPRGARR